MEGGEPPGEQMMGVWVIARDGERERRRGVRKGNMSPECLISTDVDLRTPLPRKTEFVAEGILEGTV